MSLCNFHGVEIEAVDQRATVTRAVARRWQDATMARLVHKGLSTREVALLLHFDQSTVVRRLGSMPAEARKRYASAPMEF